MIHMLGRQAAIFEDPTVSKEAVNLECGGLKILVLQIAPFVAKVARLLECSHQAV